MVQEVNVTVTSFQKVCVSEKDWPFLQPRSAARSSWGLLCSRTKKPQQSHFVATSEPLIWGSGSLTLAPMMEGPDPDRGNALYLKRGGNSASLGKWMKGQLYRIPSSVNSAACGQRADLRMLLGVLGAPLGPVHVSTLDPLPHLSIKDTPIKTSSTQYILQQYTTASGGQKIQNTIRNSYAMGKVNMITSQFETANKVIKNRFSAQTGGFVLWQMDPDMWYVELAVGGSKAHAGCNGTKLFGGMHHGLGLTMQKIPFGPFAVHFRALIPRQQQAFSQMQNE